MPIEKTDLEYETFPACWQREGAPAAGAGVRIRHLPTGIVVESQDCRTQHENAQVCMTKLKSLILKP